MSRPSAVMERLVAAITLGIAFLVMASIFVPHDTEATHGDGDGHAGHGDAHDHHGASAPTPLAVAEPWPSTDAHDGLAALGTIEDDRYVVSIFATDLGPRYTVAGRDGTILATLRTAEQVAAEFPDLPLATLDFSAPTQIMLAPPAPELP